jgi:hypothetical protein
MTIAAPLCGTSAGDLDPDDVGQAATQSDARSLDADDQRIAVGHELHGSALTKSQRFETDGIFVRRDHVDDPSLRPAGQFGKRRRDDVRDFGVLFPRLKLRSRNAWHEVGIDIETGYHVLSRSA